MSTRRPSATTLAAYQRAGGLLYELTMLAEERRSTLAQRAGGVLDSDRQLMLCAWNALALQTVGDVLTGGAGPREKETALQAARVYEQVGEWVAAGHEAAAGAVTVRHSELPRALPVDGSKPWSSDHARAMLAACGALRARAETTLVDAESIPGATELQLQVLRSRLARATAQADFAAQVCESVRFASLTPELRAQVQSAVAEALNTFFLAGQIAAVPQLADHEPASAGHSPAGRSARQIRTSPQGVTLLGLLLVLVVTVGCVFLVTSGQEPTTKPPMRTTGQASGSSSWRFRPYVVNGVVQTPIGDTGQYEPDPYYQSVQRVETAMFSAASHAIVNAHPHPTGARLVTALILASPNLPERVTANRDPAQGLGNLLATPDSAVPAANAGIGVGASNQKQFVALAYTASGTRCVFRFAYRTGTAAITP